MLNFLMAEVLVDAINDNQGTTRGGDVALHSDHAVLDAGHEIFRTKRPLLVVVVLILVCISSARWPDSAVCTQHHPGQ